MPFHVTMLLADAAQAVENKLYVIGGGWSVLNGSAPTAVALVLKVPWEQTNETHNLKLELLDSDGHLVQIPTPVGDQAITLESAFEVGRPAGIAKGSTIDLALAFTIGPLPLANGRYEWRLTIGNESPDDWRLAFQVQGQPDDLPPAANG